ncbi:hypothetical protein GE061_012843 [Apolygus lucorum]|uniref:Uncharacterized protein n=1 Tax=Apolygus lucorum TaxID=248454 RepID=A0A8S9XVI3_APOLU|nr:hypothetical protein GE061_012843 [Apolygus lucorum]
MAVGSNLICFEDLYIEDNMNLGQYDSPTEKISGQSLHSGTVLESRICGTVTMDALFSAFSYIRMNGFGTVV